MRSSQNSSRNHGQDIRPPNELWIPLKIGKGETFPLSFYYSDPRSLIPVRQVSRKLDNKSDPNLETKTYGLFSTCERGMRARVVRDGIDCIFFCTNRKNGRVLTGYYKIGWFHKGPPIKGYAGIDKPTLDDYQLAASEMKFVNPGFDLESLRGYLNGARLDRRFRTFCYIGGETARKLIELLKDTPDSTEEYLKEIKRLEKLNQESSKKGYKYENWKRTEGFSWADAPKYMGLGK